MAVKFGIPFALWTQAREEIRQLLVATAQQQTTITYTDLVARVRAVRLDPHSRALAFLLGEISEEEHNLGGAMLSALVVSKDGGEPGSGFFAAAENLGLDISDRMAFWVGQVPHAYRQWASDND